MPQETSEPPWSEPVLPGETCTDDDRCLRARVEVQELLHVRNELTAKSRASG